MATPFRELLDKLAPEQRERVEDRVQEALVEMALHELRHSRQLTQEQVAASLQIHQAAVSKMEGQSDMHLSTLRRLVGAMGGTLKLVAQFPDQEVVITPGEAKERLPR
jgi:transcriptional regulator with XRE-family HTH domain